MFIVERFVGQQRPHINRIKSVTNLFKLLIRCLFPCMYSFPGSSTSSQYSKFLSMLLKPFQDLSTFLRFISSHTPFSYKFLAIPMSVVIQIIQVIFPSAAFEHCSLPLSKMPWYSFFIWSIIIFLKNSSFFQEEFFPLTTLCYSLILCSHNTPCTSLLALFLYIIANFFTTTLCSWMAGTVLVLGITSNWHSTPQ